MFSVSLITKKVEDTFNLGFRISQYSRPRDVYCLEGHLSAGKTVFAQGFARGLGITVEVISPSFPIIQCYDHVPVLYHMDFYRLSGVDEVIHLGIDEILNESAIHLIEWPDRALDILPKDIFNIHFNTLNGSERCITISGEKTRLKEMNIG